MKKRILSLFLVLLMAAMLIPGAAITASASGAAQYDLCNEVSDKTETAWTWTVSTKTLTLKADFSINSETDLAIFCLPDGAELVIEGNNCSIKYAGNRVAITKAIIAKGDLTISGTGTLKIEAPYGIYMESDTSTLTIESGTLDITATHSNGIAANGKLVVEGGTVKIDSEQSAVMAKKGAEFAGGTLNLTSDKAYGINTAEGSALFSGADVTVSAYDSTAIVATAGCTFSAGKVIINSYGSDHAVYTKNGIITCEGKMAVFNGTTAVNKKSIAKISDGAVVIAPADDDLIIAAAVLSGTTEQAKYLPFNDVNVGDWFYDDVYYCYENGLMNGVDNYTFAPNQGITRGMIVTILWRNEGSVATTGKSFKDVARGMYYTEAVKWANAKGIVEGCGDGTFRPDDIVSLEELAAIMFRYAAYKNLDTTARGALSVYSDSETVAKWAKGPVSWAEAYNMIDGIAFGTLNPAGDATRAQAAAMLARLPQNEDDTGYVIYDLPVVEPEPVRPLG